MMVSQMNMTSNQALKYMDQALHDKIRAGAYIYSLEEANLNIAQLEMQDWPFDHIKEFMEREFPILKDIEMSHKKTTVREERLK
jgi:hypothetical protein